MCRFETAKILKIKDGIVELDRGRRARTAGVSGLKKGDWVRVYADIIVEKVDKR